LLKNAQKARSADPEHHFLSQASALIAAIQVPGNPAVLLTIFGEIGIQQIQARSPDIDAPRAHLHRTMREWNVYVTWQSFVVQQRPQWAQAWIDAYIVFGLSPRLIERLSKVPVSIQQPDTDYGNVQIAGGFQVVTSKHSEAARVNRQAGSNRELCAQVRNGRNWCIAALVHHLEIPFEVIGSLVDLQRVVRDRSSIACSNSAKDCDRVVRDIPDCGCQSCKHRRGTRFPRPSQVVRQLYQTANAVVFHMRSPLAQHRGRHQARLCAPPKRDAESLRTSAEREPVLRLSFGRSAVWVQFDPGDPATVGATMRDSLVIVPTYNELQTLEPLVEAVLRQNTPAPLNLLIVDDNSPDGTGELADHLVRRQPDRLSVLHRESKLGLGTAYVSGFRYALAHGYRHVFEMDADFSHDPAMLPVLRSTLTEADVVLGSRYVSGGAAPGWSVWRLALSQVGSAYARSVLGLPFRDLTGGFKGFRASVLAALDLSSIKSNGYAFQIEITYRSFLNGFRIVEAPIVFGPRLAGRSKMRKAIILEALLVVWRLRKTTRLSQLPQS
jgi:dolichol-phosphate mannosyltransferase